MSHVTLVSPLRMNCCYAIDSGNFISTNTSPKFIQIAAKEPSSIVCGSCKKYFRNRSLFESHNCTQTEKKIDVRRKCNKNISEINSSVQSGSEKAAKNPYVCVMNKSNQFVHLFSCKTKGNYDCVRCKEKFSEKFFCQSHVCTFMSGETYMCNFCNVNFSNVASFAKHLNVHAAVKTYYRCDNCVKGYAEIKTLQRHIVRFHSADKPRVWDLCQKSLHERDLLMKQYQTDKEKEPYVCATFSKAFCDEKDFENLENKCYVCNICHKNFSLSTSYEMHICTHTVDRGHICGVCNESFQDNDSLLIHKCYHSDGKLHICDICKEGFSEKYELLKHTLVHIKPFVCDVCNKGFDDHELLVKHAGIHIGSLARYISSGRGINMHVTQKVLSSLMNIGRLQDDMRGSSMVNAFAESFKESINEISPIIYNICKKYFSNRSLFEILNYSLTDRENNGYAICSKNYIKSNDADHDLKKAVTNSYVCIMDESSIIKHLFYHKCNKDYICVKCNETFNQNYVFKTHVCSFDGEKTFDCDFCKLNFDSITLFAKHLSIHSTVKPYYQCEKCMRIYADINNLQRHHLRAHTDDKPHIWDLCQKSLREKDSVVNDISICEKRKPHVCAKCNKAFCSGGSLKNHVCTHIGKKTYICKKCNMSFYLQNSFMKHICVPENEKTYVCDFCGEKFYHNLPFLRHMRFHTRATPYVCEVCKTSFTQKNSLKTHILIFHEKQKPFACDVCEKGFVKKATMLMHMKTHSVEKPSISKESYICKLCKKVLITKSAYNQHMFNHTIKPFVCDICRESFNDSSSLTAHIRIHVVEKRFSCIYCEQHFRDQRALDKHLVFHLGEKPYKCEICKKGFKAKIALSRHKLLIHDNQTPFDYCEQRLRDQHALDKHLVFHPGEKPYKCEICKKGFKGKITLSRHKLLIHDNQTPFVCNICQKGFLLQSGLKRHSLIHSGERPHVCNICKKGFTQKSTLKTHVFMTHENQKPFVCNICKKGFALRGSLRTHAQIHTGETPYIGIKSYVCKICNKMLFSRSGHFQHMLRHSAARPFVCYICNKGFTDKNSLVRHGYTHTGEKPFSCTICDKRFIDQSALKMHALDHADEKPYVCRICQRGFKLSYMLRKHVCDPSVET